MTGEYHGCYVGSQLPDYPETAMAGKAGGMSGREANACAFPRHRDGPVAACAPVTGDAIQAQRLQQALHLTPRLQLLLRCPEVPLDLLYRLPDVLETQVVGIDLSGDFVDVVTRCGQNCFRQQFGAATAQVVDHDEVEADLAGEVRYLQHWLAGLADVAGGEVADEEHGKVPDCGKGILIGVSLESLVEKFKGVVMDRLQAEGDMPKSRARHLRGNIGIKSEVGSCLDAIGLAGAPFGDQVAKVVHALYVLADIVFHEHDIVGIDRGEFIGDQLGGACRIVDIATIEVTLEGAETAFEGAATGVLGGMCLHVGISR